MKATVSGPSTQVTGTKRKAPRPSAETTRDGKKGKRRRQEPRPTDGLRQQASETGTPGGMGRETPVFSVSWTGDEAPKSFSKNTLETPGSLCALLGGAFVLYALGGSAKGNPAWAYILGGTLMVLGMVLADDLRPHKKLRRIMRARTLRLDSTGLTTSDPSGKQHLPWTAMKKISIHHTREIDSRAPSPSTFNSRQRPQKPRGFIDLRAGPSPRTHPKAAGARHASTQTSGSPSVSSAP